MRCIRDMWDGEALQFANAMRAGAGFSLNYCDQRVGPQFSDEWSVDVVDGADPERAIVVFSHSSGLQVTREARIHAAFNAVEYTLRFRNATRQVLTPISGVNALDISFELPESARNRVISSGGGLADATLPPRNFAIRQTCFAPTVPTAGLVELGSSGGRSSSKDLPFFFIQNDEWRAGLFVAFGWSGEWAASIFYDPAARALQLWGKIPELEIALQPGEEIQGPTVLIGLYEGDWAHGSNRLRRLIGTAHTPKLAGERFLPVATYDTWWSDTYLKFDETRLRQWADAAAAVGQECFLLDVGWYAGTQGVVNFSAGLGNWHEVDRAKLPHGLTPIAEYVRARGMKFGLWFEPERVAPGSRLAVEHPDWILWDREKEAESPYSIFSKGYGLLDYGRPEAREWVKNLFDTYIKNYGVQYIRYDFNCNPLAFWNARDTPQRRGVTQLRHIQGFYEIIDWVRARHPGVILEGCASGGLRIDLETARRFHTFWISDQSADPAIIRFHLAGVNCFLPGNYHYAAYTLPAPGQSGFEADDLGFQSFFGGAFGTGAAVDLWSQGMREMARRHVETWKRLRRYLTEDYYPLSEQPSDLRSWSGWQFHDPMDQSGFVQTFRTQTTDSQRRFVVRGLNEGDRYRFIDIYGTSAFEISGSVAMTDGIAICQAAFSSRVFKYDRVLV